MASRQIEDILGEKCSSTVICVARSAPGGLESNCALDGVRAVMYQRKHSARIRLTAPSSICRGERSILTQLVSIALPPATFQGAARRCRNVWPTHSVAVPPMKVLEPY